MRIGADDPVMGRALEEAHAEADAEAYVQWLGSTIAAARWHRRSRRIIRGWPFVSVLFLGLAVGSAIVAHPEAVLSICSVAICGTCVGLAFVLRERLR